jgi:hypothetical protein
MITVEEILPNELSGEIVGRGTKQCATFVAVRPDGKVIQVPHPERIPQLPGVTFNFGGSAQASCGPEMAAARRSSAPQSCAASPGIARSPTLPIGARVQSPMNAVAGALNRASACNIRYGGAPEMALAVVPQALNGLSAPYFPNHSQAPTHSRCGGNPFASDEPGMLTYLTGTGRTLSDVCGNLVYISTGVTTHTPGTKQWWDLTSTDFDMLPGTWW